MIPVKEVDARRLYERSRDELLALKRANAEVYDRSIMTLSSFLLAASLSFIREIVPLQNAKFIFIIQGSWICFGLSIISTIISFMYGQAAISLLLKTAENYYLNHDHEAYIISQKTEKKLVLVSLMSGTFFVMGAAMSIIFVIVNTIQGKL